MSDQVLRVIEMLDSNKVLCVCVCVCVCVCMCGCAGVFPCACVRENERD